MKKRYAALLFVLMALAAAGCGSDESREDANDVGNGNVEKSAPRVIAFNNHYPNVETKCDGFGHRIYVLTHDSAAGQNFYVIPDKTCQGPGTSYDDIVRTNRQPPVHEPTATDQPPIVVAP